jgi:HlyD family secretion protein
MWKWLIAILIIGGLAVGGWYYYQNMYLPQQAAQNAPAYETASVQRSKIASTVSATGSIEPESEVSLSFRSPGRVQNVLVSEGQTVEKGQLLAELETTDLTLALAQARVNLEIAQAQLAKLIAPPDPEDILLAQAAIEVAQASVAGADAGLNSARAAYNQLFASPSESQRQVNLSQLRQAEVNLRVAQQQYNRVKDQPNVGELPQSQQLENATVAYEVAKAQSALTEPDPTQAQVAGALNQIAQSELGLRQAQSNLIQAQNNLKTLLEGPQQEDIDIANAQVQQAQLSLLQAENSLANARLTAPFDGVVSRKNILSGELYSGGLPAIVMSDLDQFHMDLFVDEIDVRQVEIGQPVTIRVDALGDQEITGRVTEIAPTAENVGGVIAYRVTITPDATDAPLRSGMSATAIITTADVEDAILVPNRYIQLDRNSGRAYVYKLVNGQPVLQEVELGLRNERESQILAGLDAGDEVALVTASSEERLRGALFGGGN